MSTNLSSKYHRIHSLILASFLISAAMASGCRWDDSLYKKYPGPVTCTGYCVGVENLDKDGCLSLNGTWHPDDCINEVLPEVEGEVVKPAANEEECTAHSGNWKPGYCEISKTVCQEKVKLENSEIEYNKGYCMGAKELTQEECEKELTDGKPIGKWDNDHCVIDDLRCQDIHSSLENIQWLELEWHDLDYRILDIGEGEYIRCMEVKKEGDKRISCEEKSLVCGTMAQITSENPPPCDMTKTKYKQAVADMEESLPGSICQKDAAICVEVKALSEETEIGIGMCSSCPQDNVVCGNECVNVMHDPNNCGECGKECGKNQACFDGGCKSIIACPEGTVKCGYDIDEFGNTIPKCFPPNTKEYCGATCETIEISKKDNYQCETGYRCKIVEGMESIDDKVINILKILDCPSNGECQKLDEDDKYQCGCEYPASSNDKNAINGVCIDEVVEEGTIIKKQRCLEPYNSSTCGENNCLGNGINCNKHGTICQKNSDIENGFECKCLSWELTCTTVKDDGIEINCVNPNNDSTCGVTSCEQISDTKYQCQSYGDASCKGGECVCNNELVMCNEYCVDTSENYNYCGSDGTCGLNCADFEDSTGLQKLECVMGRCQCKDGYVEFLDDDGKILCLSGREDEFCGIKVIDNEGQSNYEFENCIDSNKKCVQFSPSEYKCMCVGGELADCDGNCIDPKSNPDYCGVTLLCTGGEKCTGSTPVCRDGKCESSCPKGQVACNGACITQKEYHLNNDCSGCDYNYCYTGTIDDEGVPINFDYRLCKTNDDSNKRNDIKYCGGCNLNNNAINDKGKSCDAGFICSTASGKPSCGCTLDKLQVNRFSDISVDEDNPILCLDFNDEKLHIKECEECEKGFLCSDGYEDCNKDMIDGCEIDLSSDVEHCGACNGVNLNGENSNCKESVVNAYGIECLSGVCSYYGGCLSIEDDAFGDCDGKKSTGCETSGLLSDNTNCGQCNNPCPGDKCVDGKCCWIDNKISNKTLTDADCCNPKAKVYREYEEVWYLFFTKRDLDYWQCSENEPSGDWR